MTHKKHCFQMAKYTHFGRWSNTRFSINRNIGRTGYENNSFFFYRTYPPPSNVYVVRSLRIFPKVNCVGDEIFPSTRLTCYLINVYVSFYAFTDDPIGGFCTRGVHFGSLTLFAYDGSTMVVFKKIDWHHETTMYSKIFIFIIKVYFYKNLLKREMYNDGFWKNRI